MKNEIVTHDGLTSHFKSSTDAFDIPYGCVWVDGAAKTVSEFVCSLDLRDRWICFGYSLEFVWVDPISDNKMACFKPIYT